MIAIALIVMAAWNDDKAVAEQRVLYQKKRTIIRAALEDAGFEIYGGTVGFYFWMNHHDMESSEACFEWFLQKGICVTPGTVFGPSGEGYVRMVYCMSLAKCLDCVRRIST